MAIPVSPGEILAVAKFATRLWKSCKAAPSEFQQVGKEVIAMRTIVETVHIEYQDPDSIINLVDKKPERIIGKRLKVYIHNCEEALKAVDTLLKQYERMGVKDKVLWALKGKSEVALLEANLSSSASQLDSYVSKITLKGVGLVNENLIAGLGRLEDLLEKYAGNEKAAVAEEMRQRHKSGCSKKETKRLQKLMEDYAQEVSRSAAADIEPEGTVRSTTPDPPRDHKAHKDHLTVPMPNRPRAGSVDTALDAKGAQANRRSPKKGKKPKKPKFTLECWLVQIKSAQAFFVTLEMSEKESQNRGQWKLREMAKQFNYLPAKDRLPGDHELVSWVLEDRKKKEADERYTWYAYAAKMERKGNVLLGLGVEEQAMVIIKRQLRAKPKKKKDEMKKDQMKKDEKKKDGLKTNEKKKDDRKGEKKKDEKKNANKEKDDKMLSELK